MTLSVFAPAKVNLDLRVGPPGPDGRHPLDSIVVFTRTIGDTVLIAPAPNLSLQIEGPFGADLSVDGSNLVLRAATMLQIHLNIKTGARLQLTKRLPIASGIGGGSADAAAALIGLNQFWDGGLSRESLATLASELGADVPACVYQHPLRMHGTGESVSPLGPLPKLGIVLVNPLIACPTGAVYRQYDRNDAIAPLPFAPMPNLETTAALMDYLGASANDLEQPAIELIPGIKNVLGAIQTSPSVLLTRMSGSGATSFGLYATVEHAHAAALHIKKTLALRPIWVEADEIN